MNWLDRYRISGAFTSQQQWGRATVYDNDAKPLSEEENIRLNALIKKVDSHGSPSILTKEELREYNELGKRRNIVDQKTVTNPLQTAIRPWITQ